MAFRQIVFLLLVFLPMILAAFTWADTVLLSEDVADLRDQDGAVSQSEAAELELRQLKSKISYLETIIEDRTAEVKRKDGGIKQWRKFIEEKSNSLASLQTAEKESSEVKERIERLMHVLMNSRNRIEAQKKEGQAGVPSNAAEEKIEGLKLKLENLFFLNFRGPVILLQKINNEQTSRIHKAQRALQAAEVLSVPRPLFFFSSTRCLFLMKEIILRWLQEEMLKAKLEASSMTKQLKESFVLTLWNQIGRPVFNPTIQEALKQKYEVEKWVQHHLETIKREAKMFMKPYVDQVTEITKPHLDKACLFAKPFSKKVIHYHQKISKNVREYHSLVQATLHETLNSYELTKPLATEGLVQFLASILIVLPVILLFRTLLSKEPKKRQRSSHRSHTRRRAKHANASK
ncbi:UNVERIFIED_CONTAM: hypothetical protein Scaly_1705000 [Sesamum calycinum]|uniref:Uncharacterized protein n=1 Tax=Sesamum calycinum TaxID=2727403 RepID=A0AAW2NSS4_9LAMI